MAQVPRFTLSDQPRLGTNWADGILGARNGRMEREKTAAREQASKDALTAASGPDGRINWAAAITGLMKAGNVQGATTAARMASDETDRVWRRERAEVQDRQWAASHGLARQNANRPTSDWSVSGGVMYNQRTGEMRALPKEATGPTERGLNPQYGVDANGDPVIIQLGKDGTASRTALPEGVRLSKDPIRLDAGTHFVILDPITRQQVGMVPKDLAGAEASKAMGKAEGESRAAAPGDIAAGNNALDLIGSIRNDPNREMGTGKSAYFNFVPATPGYDFQTKVDQAKSGAFLSAIQQMRGMGALSNAEGQTATQAVTRMNTATSEQEFISALDDYERIVQQGVDRASSKLSGGAGPATQPKSQFRDGQRAQNAQGQVIEYRNGQWVPAQ